MRALGGLPWYLVHGAVLILYVIKEPEAKCGIRKVPAPDPSASSSRQGRQVTHDCGEPDLRANKGGHGGHNPKSSQLNSSLRGYSRRQTLV
jgi:hypothetical protein